MLVDVQNTFCLPDFELYVGGRSGTGAVDDNRRLAAFIYRNLGRLTEITATLDTHQAIQIFHAIYLIDANGKHPAPYTLVNPEDILEGRWRFNPAVAHSLDISQEYGQEQLVHYVQQLEARQKYALTIWPYHSILGGIGHALVPLIEEAVFFHTIGRAAQADFIIKGANPFTESYSAIGPEVLEDSTGKQLARKNDQLVRLVEQFDAVVVAGQAEEPLRRLDGGRPVERNPGPAILPWQIRSTCWTTAARRWWCRERLTILIRPKGLTSALPSRDAPGVIHRSDGKLAWYALCVLIFWTNRISTISIDI